MFQRPFEVGPRGQALRGTVYTPDSQGLAPCVLMLHGFTGHRIEAGHLFVQLARALNGAGVAAVTFDFLHCGESDGSFEQMLVTGELADAVCVSQWVRSEPFADPRRLGVLGFSLGGLVAACLANQDPGPRALMLLAPTTVQNLLRLGGSTGAKVTTYGPHRLHPKLFEDAATLDPLGDLAKAKPPTLLVQGSADTIVTPEVSNAYAEALWQAGGELEETLVDGADHGFTHISHRQQVIDAVVAFATKRLAAGG